MQSTPMPSCRNGRSQKTKEFGFFISLPLEFFLASTGHWQGMKIIYTPENWEALYLMKWQWGFMGNHQFQLGNGQLNLLFGWRMWLLLMTSLLPVTAEVGTYSSRSDHEILHQLLMPKEQISYTSGSVPTGQRPLSRGCQEDIKSPPELRSPIEYRNRRVLDLKKT